MMEYNIKISLGNINFARNIYQNGLFNDMEMKGLLTQLIATTVL